MSDMRITGGGYQPQTATAYGGTSKSETVPAVSGEKREETLSLVEEMQKAREEAEKTREKFKLPKNPRRYGDAPIEAYARLARARNAGQVNAAAGYARRQLQQLKAAKRQDPENARQIQGAINQLQKAVNRAGKKRMDLAREELTEKRRRKLVEEEQLRKARRLRQQLQSQKTMRYLRESGYIREAEADQRMNAQMDAANAERRERFQAVSDAMGTGQDAVIARYAAQAAGLEAAPPAPTVTNQA